MIWLARPQQSHVGSLFLVETGLNHKETGLFVY
jgi:hypothetical protein